MADVKKYFIGLLTSFFVIYGIYFYTTQNIAIKIVPKEEIPTTSGVIVSRVFSNGQKTSQISGKLKKDQQEYDVLIKRNKTICETPIRGNCAENLSTTIKIVAEVSTSGTANVSTTTTKILVEATTTTSPRNRQIKQPTTQNPKSEFCETPIREHCAGNPNHDWFKVSEDVAFLDKQNRHGDVLPGGTWIPKTCTPKEFIAIIIPFRDREAHLQLFARNMIAFLKAQNKAFTIFAIDQQGTAMFNRAALMNIGFIESLKLHNYTCFIFHDVDMIPIHLCNIYECPATGMRHMGLSRDLKKPHYVYLNGVGGAAAFTKPVFEKINGFTNIMFGWGGEDDEAYGRLRKQGIPIHRHSAYIGNYLAIKARKGDSTNPKSGRGGECYGHSSFWKYDGLNTLSYEMLEVIQEALFTRIKVKIPGPKNTLEASTFFKAEYARHSDLLKNHAVPPVSSVMKPGVLVSTTTQSTTSPTTTTTTTVTTTASTQKQSVSPSQNMSLSSSTTAAGIDTKRYLKFLPSVVKVGNMSNVSAGGDITAGLKASEKSSSNPAAADIQLAFNQIKDTKEKV